MFLKLQNETELNIANRSMYIFETFVNIPASFGGLLEGETPWKNCWWRQLIVD